MGTQSHEEFWQAANATRLTDRNISVFTNISKPIESRKTYRCPCCRYNTLYGRGHYEICEVCFWEDDGQDDHDVDEIRGGPNGELGLSQARRNFALYKASDERFVSNVRPPLEDEKL